MEQRSGLIGSQSQKGGSKFFSECSSLNSSIVSYDSESDLDLSWENVESFEINKFLKAPSQSSNAETNRRNIVRKHIRQSRNQGKAKNRPNPKPNTILDPPPSSVSNEKYIASVIAPLNNQRKKVISKFLQKHLHIGNNTDAVEFVAKSCTARRSKISSSMSCTARGNKSKSKSNSMSCTARTPYPLPNGYLPQDLGKSKSKSCKTIAFYPFSQGYHPPDLPGDEGDLRPFDTYCHKGSKIRLRHHVHDKNRNFLLNCMAQTQAENLLRCFLPLLRQTCTLLANIFL